MNVSSGRGVFTFPRDSVYHVTKHALETYSDSLRLEMKKFGVKVSVILPGHYGAATACQDSIQVNFEAHAKRGLTYLLTVQNESVQSSFSLGSIGLIGGLGRPRG